MNLIDQFFAAYGKRDLAGLRAVVEAALPAVDGRRVSALRAGAPLRVDDQTADY